MEHKPSTTHLNFTKYKTIHQQRRDMQTQIKPYCSTHNERHDEDKANFVRKFSELFFSQLENDEDYKRVSQISEKLNTKSRDFLVKALRSSMSFDFINPII